MVTTIFRFLFLAVLAISQVAGSQENHADVDANQHVDLHELLKRSHTEVKGLHVVTREVKERFSLLAHLATATLSFQMQALQMRLSILQVDLDLEDVDTLRFKWGFLTSSSSEMRTLYNTTELALHELSESLHHDGGGLVNLDRTWAGVKTNLQQLQDKFWEAIHNVNEAQEVTKRLILNALEEEEGEIATEAHQILDSVLSTLNTEQQGLELAWSHVEARVQSTSHKLFQLSTYLNPYLE